MLEYINMKISKENSCSWPQKQTNTLRRFASHLREASSVLATTVISSPIQEFANVDPVLMYCLLFFAKATVISLAGYLKSFFDEAEIMVGFLFQNLGLGKIKSVALLKGMRC